MNKDFGYTNSLPSIKSVRFRKDNMVITLADGRILSVPLEHFPEIKNLTPAQRRKHSTLTGMGLMFDDIDEMVYHVSDFLGASKNAYYDLPENEMETHSMVAEPRVKYNKSAH